MFFSNYLDIYVCCNFPIITEFLILMENVIEFGGNVQKTQLFVLQYYAVCRQYNTHYSRSADVRQLPAPAGGLSVILAMS